MKPLWIIEKALVLNYDYGALLIDELNKKNIKYNIVEYKPFLGILADIDKIDPNLQPIVSYGSIGFIKEINRLNKSLIPGAYYSDINFKITKYIHQFPENLFLNENYISLPYKQFKRSNIKNLMSYFNSNSIFIKPDSGFKAFSGTNIDTENYDLETKTIEALTSGTDDTMCIISGSKTIYEEYRFTIANRKVVSGTQYMKNGVLDIKKGYDEAALSLAQKIADNEWQPDICYTCDIGRTGDNIFKVIELNSFSCAGLYLGDISNIVDNINESAVLEFNNEISING